MSKEYEGQDPLAIAQQAERDLNSNAMKQGEGSGASDSSTPPPPPPPSTHYEPPTDTPSSAKDSGVNENVINKFPGSEVKIGSAASGAGDNREIPLDEGGDINPRTGQ